MDGKIIILMAAALFACSGCATQQVWNNPQKTQQQFYQDAAKCEVMANSAGTDNYYSTRQAWDRIFGNCMRGEGWTLSEER